MKEAKLPYGVAGLRRDYEAALAENARLRAALEKISNIWGVAYEAREIAFRVLNQQTVNTENK